MKTLKSESEESHSVLRKLYLAFIIFHTSIVLCFAQQQSLDSLFAVWENESVEDSIRLESVHQFLLQGSYFISTDSILAITNSYLSLARGSKNLKQEAIALSYLGLVAQQSGDLKRSVTIHKEAIKIAEDNDYPIVRINLLITTSGIWYRFNEIDSALYYVDEAIALAKIGNFKKEYALALQEKASLLVSNGIYSPAVQHYRRAAKTYTEIGDLKGEALIQLHIGQIYYDNEEFDKAAKYFTLSDAYFKETNEPFNKAYCKLLIAGTYIEQGKLDKALLLFQGLLQLDFISSTPDYAGPIYGNIGLAYTKMGEYDLAEENLKKYFQLASDANDKRGLSEGYLAYGNLYNKQEKFRAAAENCTRAYDLAREINFLPNQKKACECLYMAYKGLNDGIKALEYHELMTTISDSIENQESVQRLREMEYEKKSISDSLASLEKERQVELAHQKEVRKKDRTRNISIGIGAFVLLLAGGLFSRLRYVRKSKANLQVEKDRSENLLLNILPADIAAELKEKGKADARDFEMVSILFTDFKGFTEQSAKLSAAALVNEINHCFEAFDGIMEKYGIEKIKTIGDAYMAAGGLPVPTDDSVKNTVLAALEMQEFIVQRHQTKVQSGEPAFEMRVGIHTGPVVAGIVGVKKFQYDIWGDTVNTASRMESAGEVGKVNISEATYELLKDDAQFQFDSRGRIEAKGKGEMEMLFVSLKK